MRLTLLSKLSVPTRPWHNVKVLAWLPRYLQGPYRTRTVPELRKHARHPKINRPPLSRAFIHSAFARSPSHRRHRETQAHHRPFCHPLPTILPLSIHPQRRLRRSMLASLSSHAPSPMHAQPVSQVTRTACTLSSTRSSSPLSAAGKRKDNCKNASPVCTSFHNSSTSSLQLTSPAKIDSRALSKKGPDTVSTLSRVDYRGRLPPFLHISRTCLKSRMDG